jgi:tRNA A37 methylthiotransferase MiaB
MKFLGRTLNVLVENVKNGLASGISENYLRVTFEADVDLRGEIVKVLILEDRDSGALFGKSTVEYVAK